MVFLKTIFDCFLLSRSTYEFGTRMSAWKDVCQEDRRSNSPPRRMGSPGFYNSQVWATWKGDRFSSYHRGVAITGSRGRRLKNGVTFTYALALNYPSNSSGSWCKQMAQHLRKCLICFLTVLIIAFHASS